MGEDDEVEVAAVGRGGLCGEGEVGAGYDECVGGEFGDAEEACVVGEAGDYFWGLLGGVWVDEV